jgi:chemotaxis response regulator CheB
MATRRVFVIWIHPLFHESVRLLLTHPDIEWLGATSDHSTALTQIEKLCPDTILLEEEEGSNASAEALEILEASSTNMRVIRLNLADNELKIYRREDRTVAQAEDLLHLIQNH